MASHVLINEDLGERNHARAHDEERRAQVMIIQVLENLPGNTMSEAQPREAFASTAYGAVAGVQSEINTSTTCEQLTVGSWAIIETDTPGELIGTRDDIVTRRVSTARPPATILGVRSRLRVSGTFAIDRGGEGRDIVTVELLHPLFDLIGSCIGRCLH